MKKNKPEDEEILVENTLFKLEDEDSFEEININDDIYDEIADTDVESEAETEVEMDDNTDAIVPFPDNTTEGIDTLPDDFIDEIDLEKIDEAPLYEQKIWKKGLIIALATVAVLAIGVLIWMYMGKNQKTDFTQTQLGGSINDTINNASENDTTETDGAIDEENSTEIIEDTNQYSDVMFLPNEQYQEVVDLVKEYFTCLQAGDTEALNQLIYEGKDNPIDEEFVSQRKEIIEEYKNVTCYILDGLEENTYVVYIYCDVMFYHIDTAAPLLSRLFIIEDEEQKPAIYNAQFSTEQSQYLSSLNKAKEVMFLSTQVTNLLDKACQKDEKLKALVELLNGK